MHSGVEGQVPTAKHTVCEVYQVQDLPMRLKEEEELFPEISYTISTPLK